MRATWGKRCNKILLMSSIADDEVPTVKLKLGDGGDKYSHLWGKTKSAFRYVYQNHFEEYDWFVKADDDTYMIIENLRYLLKDYNSSSPLYFGRKFKPFVKQGYMSGGAGYVLSKEALRRLVEVCKSVFVNVKIQLYCSPKYIAVKKAAPEETFLALKGAQRVTMSFHLSVSSLYGTLNLHLSTQILKLLNAFFRMGLMMVTCAALKMMELRMLRWASA